MTTPQETKKLSIEETMKQIELETEAKVIEGYKTDKIQMPTLTEDCKNIKPIKNADQQMSILQSIMEEGNKKFEAAAGRKMTYWEMRSMYG